MAVIKNTDTENDPAKIGTRYTVRAPHPEFGENPNIINEYGHTVYPKYVDHPTLKQKHTTTTYLGKDQSRLNTIETNIPERVIVNSKEEEDALMAGVELPKVKQKKAWAS